jgi:pyrroloquinoline quinone (PQQ) biosynthesis protein C
MSQLPGWMPELLSRISVACSESPLLSQNNVANEVFEFGSKLCLELWPFIHELPQNVDSLRRRTPEDHHSAIKLFTQLADDERVYQQLYLRQCELGGLSSQDLQSAKPSRRAKRLAEMLQHYCARDSFENGVIALVTTELSATACARAALPLFESYFARHLSSYHPDSVESGLQWLRLHAKPNLRQALWLQKMLADLKLNESKSLPKPADDVITSLAEILEVKKQFTPTLVEECTLPL